MELKFANGKKIKIVRFMPSMGIIRGPMREVLSFMVEESAHGYDELKELFTDQEATKRMSVINPHNVDGGGTSNTITEFENYIVAAEPVIQMSREVVDQLNPLPVDVFLVSVGKLIYVEEQLQKLGINPLG